MGTRSLTVVKKDGEYKIAKYCQWDGYPSGRGVELLEFLSATPIDVLSAAVGRTVIMTDGDIRECWLDCGADESGTVSRAVSEKFKKQYPMLHRDTGGAEFLRLLIALSGRTGVPCYIEFAADSLMCEWCYVIDLDEGVFDIYKGFNEQPLTEKDRFYYLEPMIREKTHSGRVYHPVKLAWSYLLSHLPTAKQFCTDLGDEE
jgi:hypothetical protein